MFENLKDLYENCLWSSIVQVAPYVTASSNMESSDQIDGRCGKRRYLVLVMIADAHFESRDFKKAEPLYKDAIQLKKQLKLMKKSDGVSASSRDEFQPEGRLGENSSDVEVKFKLHLCYINTNQVRLV